MSRKKPYIPLRETITERVRHTETVLDENGNPYQVVTFKDVPVNDLPNNLPSREDLDPANLMKAGINPTFVNPDLLSPSDPHDVEDLNNYEAGVLLGNLPNQDIEPEPTPEPTPEPQPKNE